MNNGDGDDLEEIKNDGDMRAFTNMQRAIG